METGDCFQNLRKCILCIFPLDENSLSSLVDIFSPATINNQAYFSKSGDYSTSMAFICKGIIQSFYNDHLNNKVTRDIFSDHMFVMPMPSFLYRKPSYLNFQAITDSSILLTKYSKLEELSLNNSTINKFVRTLIDREWIINREIHESSIYIYNNNTRFRMFYEKYHNKIYEIQPSVIASYLNIPIKQVEKLLKGIEPSVTE